MMDKTVKTGSSFEPNFSVFRFSVRGRDRSSLVFFQMKFVFNQWIKPKFT